MSTAPRSKSEPQIDVAAPEDAAGLAALWAVCSPRSVWTRLGPRLATIYFRRFCSGPQELAVAAWLDGRLVGGCVGTGRPGSYGRAFYREHGGELARAFARELLSRPAVLGVVLGRAALGLLGRLRTGRGGPGLGVALDGACYMSDFFVDPAARGHQLGTLMLERFCAEMAARGSAVCVVHTLSDNVSSQVAQRRAGFECVHREGSDLTFVRRLAA
jgi:GNAT superfamily N-acetyltransferase